MILMGIGDEVTGYCTGCRRSSGYQGRGDRFLFGMPRKGRVSGMIEGVFVPNTRYLRSIWYDIRLICTEHPCIGMVSKTISDGFVPDTTLWQQ